MEIVHHGGAIQVEPSGATLRLKDLVPAHQLGDGSRRIRRAAAVTEATVELELSDGSRHRVRIPSPGRNAGPADLVVRNASQVLTMEGPGLGVIERGAVVCRDGVIIDVCPDDELERRFSLAPSVRIVDAGGGIVSPGLIDPHTHVVFAGERAAEFGMKAEGRTYLEIHRAGGGILATVRATRAAAFEELAASCSRNLSRLLAWGVTTCEAKSGYALSLEGELRLLEVLRTASDCHHVDVVPTLLAAHALPPEFANDRAGYVALITEELIPRAAAEGLAEYCDAYCEESAFRTDEVERMFAVAREHGLGLRLHAEQFTDQGGAELASRLGAASADHLEAISSRGIQALAGTSTTAVLLPGAALSCRCPWPPARALRDAGVAIALGTDLNPGSSLTSSLPLMMSLACMQMRMSCEEAWRAVTLEAARTLGRSNLGRLARGCRADLVVFAATDYRYVPYHFGDNHVTVVIKSGQVALHRDPRVN